MDYLAITINTSVDTGPLLNFFYLYIATARNRFKVDKLLSCIENLKFEDDGFFHLPLPPTQKESIT